MKNSCKYNDLIKNLNSGNICLFETDTVVGIGCKIFNKEQINNKIFDIFNIKKREINKTFPWLISSIQMLDEFTVNIPKFGEKLIKKNWPGATTLIFEASRSVPNVLSSKNHEGVSTIACRIPDSEELITAIDYLNCPIACTSANFSGEKAPLELIKVKKSILNKVDFVYEKQLHKNYNEGASEIINCVGQEPKIIRTKAN